MDGGMDQFTTVRTGCSLTIENSDFLSVDVTMALPYQLALRSHYLTQTSTKKSRVLRQTITPVSATPSTAHANRLYGGVLSSYLVKVKDKSTMLLLTLSLFGSV